MTEDLSCIVILGPGRSGTSVATKLLVEAGMRLSTTVVPPSIDNPMGHFEDARVAALHQQLFSAWQLSPYAPRDTALLADPSTQDFSTGLAPLVEGEVAASTRIWGVKDPRISMTWPIWQHVLADASITPRPVFCVRDPHAVVRSLTKAYAMAAPHAEALYLFRTLQALEDVTQGWFFVQYEFWHDRLRAQDQLQSLVSYCGIDTSGGTDLRAIATANVRSDLNRSSGSDITVSPILSELHELLRGFAGSHYDAAAISEWCGSVHSRLADFAFIHRALEDLRNNAAPSAARRALRKAVLTARDITARDITARGQPG